MKKLLLLLAFVASLCACTTQTQRANALIGEYEEKYELANCELNELMVSFSPEEWDYVIANANYWANETIIAVGKNWKLEMQPMEEQRLSLAGEVEKAKCPLTSEQDVVLHKYAEATMYLATVKVLKRWLELN